MNFEAEIKKVETVKSASGDMVYKITFVTDNPGIMQLGMLDGQTTVKVTVDVNG